MRKRPNLTLPSAPEPSRTTAAVPPAEEGQYEVVKRADLFQEKAHHEIRERLEEIHPDHTHAHLPRSIRNHTMTAPGAEQPAYYAKPCSYAKAELGQHDDAITAKRKPVQLSDVAAPVAGEIMALSFLKEIGSAPHFAFPLTKEGAPFILSRTAQGPDGAPFVATEDARQQPVALPLPEQSLEAASSVMQAFMAHAVLGAKDIASNAGNTGFAGDHFMTIDCTVPFSLFPSQCEQRGFGYTPEGGQNTLEWLSDIVATYRGQPVERDGNPSIDSVAGGGKRKQVASPTSESPKTGEGPSAFDAVVEAYDPLEGIYPESIRHPDKEAVVQHANHAFQAKVRGAIERAYEETRETIDRAGDQGLEAYAQTHAENRQVLEEYRAQTHTHYTQIG